MWCRAKKPVPRNTFLYFPHVLFIELIYYRCTGAREKERRSAREDPQSDARQTAAENMADKIRHTRYMGITKLYLCAYESIYYYIIRIVLKKKKKLLQRHPRKDSTMKVFRQWVSLIIYAIYNNNNIAIP